MSGMEIFSRWFRTQILDERGCREVAVLLSEDWRDFKFGGVWW